MGKKCIWPRWLILMIFYIVFTCTFFFAEKALGYYELEYRTVTVVAGKSIVWMIPWIAGIFLIRLWNRKSAEKERNCRLVFSPIVLSDPISDLNDLCQRNNRRYGIITASDRGEKGWRPACDNPPFSAGVGNLLL